MQVYGNTAMDLLNTVFPEFFENHTKLLVDVKHRMIGCNVTIVIVGFYI